jgi:predicted metalloprotease with PDZ domain
VAPDLSGQQAGAYLRIPMKPIRYSIIPKHPAAHVFEVTLTVTDPDPQGQQFMLPVWIPGSYLVREFARNIVTLRATNQAGRKVAVVKLNKNTWRAAAVDGPLTLTYEVYAWDLSVRAAHLDESVGFFNGTSVFLAVAGREQEPCEVEIRRPEGNAYRGWRVATALREARGTRRYAFGLYVAQDYDELIDHPVTVGEFELARFDAHRVPHDVVIAGKVQALDMPRLCADLKRICEAQIALFEPRTKRAPMDRYVFMTLAVGDGYGGLEHRASTALICKRDDLPAKGKPQTTDGYRSYLGLCSHEYFHTWNVKRIKPAAFAPYDLTQENYTPLLWLFEGFTSYYESLMLVRAGLISQDEYLAQLGKTIGSVLRGAGRLRQTVAESSFDAWIKYYRQDENAGNAIVSYYTKGSLIALAFDLSIRAQTRHRKSLDDVMRLLWQRYGRDFYTGRPTGVEAADIPALFAEASGADLSRLFRDAVNGTRDLPLDALLAPFGVELAAADTNGRPSLGARWRTGSDCTLASVYDGGAAQKAGLSAGDVLVAIDGLRVPGSGPDALLARYRPGDVVQVHAFRRDELRAVRLKLDAPEVAHYTLTARPSPASAKRARDAWLHAGR